MWSPQNPSNPPPPPITFASLLNRGLLVSLLAVGTLNRRDWKESGKHRMFNPRWGLKYLYIKVYPAIALLAAYWKSYKLQAKLIPVLLGFDFLHSICDWSRKKKTRPNLSTDKMQNQNQSWLDRTRFPALESVGVFLKSPHWLLVFTMGFRSQQSIAMRHNGPVIKYVQGLLAFKRSGCFTP